MPNQPAIIPSDQRADRLLFNMMLILYEFSHRPDWIPGLHLNLFPEDLRKMLFS